VTSSSEYSIAIASEVARSYGLPHPDPEAVRACRDKGTQRARLRDAGLPGPAFAVAASPGAAVEAAAGIGLPVVVKPVAGSGSIGVRRCADLAEVEAAARAVLEVDPAELALPAQSGVVVEEYLTGAEYSVETLDDRVVGVTRKHLGPEPWFVEIGHDFPARLSPEDRAAIGESAVAALRALGLAWGPAHVEIRCTATGPRVIEVNPRLAGGMLPRVVQEAHGVDLVHQTVARAAGLPVDLTPKRDLAASIRFLVVPDAGRLAGIDRVEEARRLPGVVEVGLTREVGQDLVIRHSFQDRLGYVIASAPDGTRAAQAAEAGLRTVQVRIAPASLVTEGSLGS
jgi:argininosuccinate lyase